MREKDFRFPKSGTRNKNLILKLAGCFIFVLLGTGTCYILEKNERTIKISADQPQVTSAVQTSEQEKTDPPKIETTITEPDQNTDKQETSTLSSPPSEEKPAEIKPPAKEPQKTIAKDDVPTVESPGTELEPEVLPGFDPQAFEANSSS